MGLTEIIPAGEYRFRMGLERGDPEAFFRSSAQNEALLSQRKHWLEAFPNRHAALLPAGEKLVEETIEFALKTQTVPPEFRDSVHAAKSDWSNLLTLGGAWEPDFLLLQLENDGAFRLVGGCVCFPSSWSLEEKMGHGLETIHSVVPGLNTVIGAQIQAFLGKLRTGTAWLRTNWGLSRSSELNQHPARDLPRLDGDITPGEVWLRVEHQALVGLPQTNGVLFGIRIAMHALTAIQQDELVSARLAQALRTMPEEVARYKGLASARCRLLGFLES